MTGRELLQKILELDDLDQPVVAMVDFSGNEAPVPILDAYEHREGGHIKCIGLATGGTGFPKEAERP